MLARVVQGLSVGGEYGASATYMSEMAGKARAASGPASST
jgi:MHS family alpha-ketoglutarate permease-like MFS transporter